MPSAYSRRRVLRRSSAALGIGVSLAGCLGTPPTATDETTTTSRPETTDDQTVTPENQTHDSLSDISDEEAETRALAAEKVYLESRLQNASCLLSWGTTPTTSNEEATVVERTAEGVVVDVRHPYWYSTEDQEADLSSHAFYLVTETSVERTSGDDVAPC